MKTTVKLLLTLITIASTILLTHQPTYASSNTSLQKEIAKLEILSGGRIGVYAINTAKEFIHSVLF